MASVKDTTAINIWMKYILFGICFLWFLLTGACTGVIGYYISTLENLRVDTFCEFLLNWALVVLTLSAFICLMMLAGWIGALREYTICLLIFRAMLGFFLLVEIAVVILIFLLAYEPSTLDRVCDESEYIEAIIKYRESQSHQETIDALQRDRKCCGLSNNDEGYKDWSRNQYFNCSDFLPDNLKGKFDFCSVPYSCCKEQSDFACGKNMASPDTDLLVRANTIYTRGCLKALAEYIEENILWIGIVALCVMIPEILLYKIASDFSYQIEKQRKKWQHTQTNFDRISMR